MSIVVPAVLPSSRKDLTDKLALFTDLPQVESVQIDVVDGKFAAPATWPYTAPKELKEMLTRNVMLPHLDRIRYEIDLMCRDAETIASAFLALGATRLTFHAESVTDLPKLLASARRRFGGGAEFTPGLVSFGLAVNIETDLSVIESNLEEIQYVQFMGIARIGKQGQPFDRRVLEKIRVFHGRHPQLPVQVDGGVSLANAKELMRAGASSLVVGSALTASDPSNVIAQFEELQNSYGV